MKILHRLRDLYRWLIRRQEVERGLAEELEEYVDQSATDKIRRGMDAKQARREARLELGGIEQTKESVRSRRPLHWLDDLRRDLIYGVRILRHRRVFALAVVLSLALGIGANTAIFTLMNAVMWRTLPVDDPANLWSIGNGYRYQEYELLAGDQRQAKILFNDK